MDPATPISFGALLFSDPTSEKRSKREGPNFFPVRKTLPKKNWRHLPITRDLNFQGPPSA
ncbi:MAG: hypothetical protein WCJ95_21670 [Mariniphaga sp.]